MTDNDHSWPFKASVEKQFRANQKADADYRKYLHDSRQPTPDEIAAAEKAGQYTYHKANGSLGTYYELYPEDRPRVREHDDDERER